MADLESVWDRDVQGPGTVSTWDRDWDGPGTRSVWDRIPAVVGRAVAIVWQASAKFVSWRPSRKRVKWR